MADAPITRFDPNPERLEPLAPATEYFGSLDPEAEWPGNILSNRTFAYGDGTIARRGNPVAFAVDPGELALCRRLAAEAAATMAGAAVRAYPYLPFFVAAQEGAPVASRIDPDLIRSRFGGTIFPPAEVSVEPLGEGADWWAEVASASDGPELEAWRSMTRWFWERPEFMDTAFVRIGENLDEANDPPPPIELKDWYVEQYGVVRPRLALGLTNRGSLVGWAVCEVRA